MTGLNDSNSYFRMFLLPHACCLLRSMRVRHELLTFLRNLGIGVHFFYAWRTRGERTDFKMAFPV